MSTFKANTLGNVAGSKSVPMDTVVDGSAKAWVNFNGTGVVAIRAAFNVASITDNGVGDYTVNFTSALPDANFAAVGTPSDTSGAYGFRVISLTTTSVRVQSTTTGNVDAGTVGLAVFR